MLAKELRQPVEEDHVHLIVQIDMVGAVDDHQFLRLGRGCLGILAEVK